MKLVILAEGKLKDRALRGLVDDYLKRIRRYARCEELELGGPAELSRAVPADATLIALEVDGEAVSSVELSKRLERWMTRGKGVVAFAIGGAEGLPRALSERADVRLSLSPLTLPHRLARLILVEQLYRAFTIARGEPYAREG
ncbi:MAG TPA: 23S rRNA (pseudouridine(1915)-N(3))-methyltransferase RlmH [Polyangiaceae bacterium]|nr:23S rRNA (pseudouridine(1915)-N(3))-methyltransferase RlmH [Polyangiaceae bacterium]